MLTVLYVVQFIIAFLLIFSIFLQRKEETTSLLSSNAYNSMFKSMAVPSNPLIKITLIIGVLFFLNSILIGAILLKQSKAPNPLIEKVEEYNKTNAPSSVAPPKANLDGKANKTPKVNSKTTNSKMTNNKGNTKSDTVDNKKRLPAVPLGNVN